MQQGLKESDVCSPQSCRRDTSLQPALFGEKTK